MPSAARPASYGKAILVRCDCKSPDSIIAYVRERLATYPPPLPPIGPAEWRNAALNDEISHNQREAMCPQSPQGK